MNSIHSSIGKRLLQETFASGLQRLASDSRVRNLCLTFLGPTWTIRKPACRPTQANAGQRRPRRQLNGCQPSNVACKQPSWPARGHQRHLAHGLPAGPSNVAASSALAETRGILHTAYPPDFFASHSQIPIPAMFRTSLPVPLSVDPSAVVMTTSRESLNMPPPFL